MKYLNSLPGFEWAKQPDSNNYAKVCVNTESFWLFDCKVVEYNKSGSPAKYTALIDNALIQDGLELGEEISFLPTLDYSE